MSGSIKEENNRFVVYCKMGTLVLWIIKVVLVNGLEDGLENRKLVKLVS